MSTVVHAGLWVAALLLSANTGGQLRDVLCEKKAVQRYVAFAVLVPTAFATVAVFLVLL